MSFPTYHIQNELRHADLGDKRRNKRLVKIATTMASSPEPSFPKM